MPDDGRVESHTQHVPAGSKQMGTLLAAGCTQTPETARCAHLRAIRAPGAPGPMASPCFSPISHLLCKRYRGQQAQHGRFQRKEPGGLERNPMLLSDPAPAELARQKIAATACLTVLYSASRHAQNDSHAPRSATLYVRLSKSSRQRRSHPAACHGVCASSHQHTPARTETGQNVPT